MIGTGDDDSDHLATHRRASLLYIIRGMPLQDNLATTYGAKTHPDEPTWI